MIKMIFFLSYSYYFVKDETKNQAGMRPGFWDFKAKQRKVLIAAVF